MKISTFLQKRYALVFSILFISSLSYSQTADFKVQHVQDDIGNTGGTNTSFTSVSSLNNAVAIANNNRKTNAGPNGNGGNHNGDDVSGSRKLTGTGTLTYYRQAGSSSGNMRFNSSIWEYVGPPGGNNEMIVRGRYVVSLNGGTNSTTQALTGITNANKCIPFITGITNSVTSQGADAGTAIAYLENSTTMRVQKGTNGNNINVYITLVEFTGSNWTVLHGDSGNASADTGTITLRDGSDGTGTATNVSNWSDAIIFSHHRGDMTTNGTNDAIADNWPVMDPGSNNQRVDWTFNSNHDSNATNGNRHFVHVLNNTGLNVTRYQNSGNAAGQTTFSIASASLTNINEALIVGSSTSSGSGQAYARGWRNYYLNSTTQAAHWSHRSGNTMSHEIQIIDLAGLTTSAAGPEMNITGNAVSINDGDTTPSLADDTDFGNVDITLSTNPNTFTIQNLGTAILNLTGGFPYVTVSGAHAGDFTLTANPASSILAGGSTTFTITFNPSAVGLRTATITIANNDSDERPYNFNIQGNGTSAIQEMNVTGNSIDISDGDTTPSLTDDTDFGGVELTSGTNVNTFIIENTGGTLSLNLTGIPYVVISGAHEADFTVTAIPSNWISAGGNTSFNITFNPSALGLRTASISIANNDTDESPYNFNIQGTGIACGSTVLHTAGFESSYDGWSSGGADATRFNNATYAYNGNYSLMIRDNSGNASSVISPLFDISNYNKIDIKFFFKPVSMENAEDFFVEYSSDGGTTWIIVETFRSGYVASKGGDFNVTGVIPYTKTVTLFDTAYTFPAGNSARFRVRCDASATDDQIYLDEFKITGTSFCTPTTAPGGITSNLDLWLKADQVDGATVSTDGNSVSQWIDNGKGNHAEVTISAQEPTYRNNTTQNFNFNPVIEFDNDNSSSTGNMTHLLTDRQVLKGTGGFNSNDIYVVLIPDLAVTTGMIPMDTFTGDDPLTASYTEDVTGFGYGGYTARMSGEYFAYCIGGTTTSSPYPGYGSGDTSATTNFDQIGIMNLRHNATNTSEEIYLNSIRIDDIENDAADFAEIKNTKYNLGRSQYWSGSYNGRIAEVITYTVTNNDANDTDARNRIQSYLAIKYGITLAPDANGTTKDYVNSDGNVIWDQSAHIGYNHDIAGIGRDDVSELNQKQSRSVNDAVDGTGRIEGVLTMGLTEIYDTNSENVSTNGTTLNDKEYLVWGNNGADLNLAATTVNVNMSAGISPALTTNVSFTAMQRIWKVVETGGDIPSVKVRIPQAAIRNITPPGNFYMFISSTGVFDPTADYRIMTSDGNGNLETTYDFDNTNYITFGYAPQVIVERSIYFDGAVDYIDMEDNLELDPTGFTISAWIKRDAADSGTKSIISKRGSFFSSGYDLRILDNNRIQMWWKNGSNQIANSTTQIPDDEWHHVAVIYDGTSAFIYIDGVLSSTTNRTPPIATDESFYIGAAGKNSPTQHFRGNIDEVRVWDTNLTLDQLRFIMNQEIEDNATFVAGKELPTTITKNDIATIPWSDLAGYYPMSVYTYTNTDDASGNSNQGALRNLDTVDRQTAPLPYISQDDDDWIEPDTWLNGDVQTIPNELSIVDGTTPIDWNIVRIGHEVIIATEIDLGRERQVLGLYVDAAGELIVDGDNADAAAGNGLTVSHYLKLDGKIDLEGQSQLVQGLDSDLDPTSSGSVEKDQQGTADVFTYNYWSSPVGEINATTNNNSYTVTDIMFDDTVPVNFLASGYDGTTGSPIGIADYWIWKFANQADDDYSAWQHVRMNGTLLSGEGFTMKGPGTGTIVDQQNYVFLGKPNNGNINLTLNAGNDYLIGNPYPSAIDANQFITDNGPTITGAGADPTISGTLYFWEHWGGGSHNLHEYQGGYATYNFSGGVGAPSLGTNDPDTATGGTPTKLPARYIPVSQGFFVVGETTGTINFNNGQRIYRKEGLGISVFVRSAGPDSNIANYESEDVDDRMKFRIGFNSVNTIHRQLLLTIDENTTTGYDWAYDGKIYDNQMDDLYWIIDNEMYTIQGSDEANPDSVYPLGIRTRDDGMNTITIDKLEYVPDNIEIYIHDILNDTYHDLRESDFEIFLTAGEHLNRFELTFSEGDSLSIEEQELNTIDAYYNMDTESIVLYNPKLVDVKSIELINILGQHVITINNISEMDYSEYQVKNLSTGTYILKIDTLSGLLSKKVLVE